MYDEDVAQADTNEEKKEEQVCMNGEAICCFHEGGIVQRLSVNIT